MFLNSFDMAETYWSKHQIESRRFGALFLFTLSDYFFPDFVDTNGMADLQLWTNGECAFLVLHAPSKEYFESVRHQDEAWLGILRDQGFSGLIDEPILKTDDEFSTIREIFASCRNPYHRNREVREALAYWGLAPTEHPCLIFFKNLGDQDGWFVGLRPMRGVQPTDLGSHLHSYFSGKDFRKLIQQLEGINQ